MMSPPISKVVVDNTTDAEGDVDPDPSQPMGKTLSDAPPVGKTLSDAAISLFNGLADDLAKQGDLAKQPSESVSKTGTGASAELLKRSMSLRLSQMPISDGQKANLKAFGLSNSNEITGEEVIGILDNRDFHKSQAGLLKKLVVMLIAMVILLLAGTFGLSFMAVEITKESHVESGVLVDTDGTAVGTKKVTTKIPDLLSVYTMTAKELLGLTRVTFNDKSGNLYVESIARVVKYAKTGTVKMDTALGGSIYFDSKLVADGKREKVMRYKTSASTDGTSLEISVGVVDKAGRRLQEAKGAEGLLECEGGDCPTGTELRLITVSDAFMLVCGDDTQQNGAPSNCVETTVTGGNMCSICDLRSPAQILYHDSVKKHLYSLIGGQQQCFQKMGSVSGDGNCAEVVISELNEITFTHENNGRRLTETATAPVGKVEVFGSDGRRLADSRNLGGCNWWDAAVAYAGTGGKYGNWCGKGQPGKDAAGGVLADMGGYLHNLGGQVHNLDVKVVDKVDETCAKHDHGSYSQDVFGVLTANYCEVDAIFQTERRSQTKTSANKPFYDGAECLFGVVPCLMYTASPMETWCGVSGGFWGFFGLGAPCYDNPNKARVVRLWPYGDYNGGCEERKWSGGGSCRGAWHCQCHDAPNCRWKGGGCYADGPGF